MQTKELSSLYMISCILQIVKQRELVNRIGLELLKKSCSNNEVVISDVQSAEASPSLKTKEDIITYESSRCDALSKFRAHSVSLILVMVAARQGSWCFDLIIPRFLIWFYLQNNK